MATGAAKQNPRHSDTRTRTQRAHSVRIPLRRLLRVTAHGGAAGRQQRPMPTTAVMLRFEYFATSASMTPPNAFGFARSSDRSLNCRPCCAAQSHGSARSPHTIYARPGYPRRGSMRGARGAGRGVQTAGVCAPHRGGVHARRVAGGARSQTGFGKSCTTRMQSTISWHIFSGIPPSAFTRNRTAVDADRSRPSLIVSCPTGAGDAPSRPRLRVCPATRGRCAPPACCARLSNTRTADGCPSAP